MNFDDISTNYSEKEDSIQAQFQNYQMLDEEKDIFDVLASEQMNQSETPPILMKETETTETGLINDNLFQHLPDSQEEPEENHHQIPRTGKTLQSNVQKIIKKIIGAHLCKNLPSEIFRKIKNFLSPTKRLHLLDMSKKRMSREEFQQFISFSGLAEEEWQEIFSLARIQEQIDKSKKLGTSKFLDKISALEKSFLIEMYKSAQKIIYRSVKRVVKRALDDEKIESYMDSQCHTELHELDMVYDNHAVYAKTYQSFLTMLN